MKKEYIKYENVTKEILDTIQIGNLVRINNWKKPMRVVGVSENYFVMIKNMFGQIYYSVCSKKPWGTSDRMRHNAMRGGMYHCSRDNMLFGYGTFDYKFDNVEAINEYLDGFEKGEVELSERAGVPIYTLYVK